MFRSKAMSFTRQLSKAFFQKARRKGKLTCYVSLDGQKGCMLSSHLETARGNSLETILCFARVGYPIEAKYLTIRRVHYILTQFRPTHD